MVRKQVENLQGLVLTPEELDFIKPIIRKSLEMNTQATLMNGAGDVLEEIPVYHINPVPQWEPEDINIDEPLKEVPFSSFTHRLGDKNIENKKICEKLSKNNRVKR